MDMEGERVSLLLGVILTIILSIGRVIEMKLKITYFESMLLQSLLLVYGTGLNFFPNNILFSDIEDLLHLMDVDSASFRNTESRENWEFYRTNPRSQVITITHELSEKHVYMIKTMCEYCLQRMESNDLWFKEEIRIQTGVSSEQTIATCRKIASALYTVIT